MSFFQWVREGVRQAVVLGLADAVEDVGTRVREEDLGPALAKTLRERLAVAPSDVGGQTVLESPAVATAPRRRLGRSIDALRKAA
ncbi:MAG: hypothetical protein EBS56_03140 [Planctomycetia bacterium]|nr:hypothetical protein [Planctomycetia bacterium]